MSLKINSALQAKHSKVKTTKEKRLGENQFINTQKE